MDRIVRMHIAISRFPKPRARLLSLLSSSHRRREEQSSVESGWRMGEQALSRAADRLASIEHNARAIYLEWAFNDSHAHASGKRGSTWRPCCERRSGRLLDGRGQDGHGQILYRCDGVR